MSSQIMHSHSPSIYTLANNCALNSVVNCNDINNLCVCAARELECESGLRHDAEGSAETVSSRIRDYDMQLLAYK